MIVVLIVLDLFCFKPALTWGGGGVFSGIYCVPFWGVLRVFCYFPIFGRDDSYFSFLFLFSYRISGVSPKNDQQHWLFSRSFQKQVGDGGGDDDDDDDDDEDDDVVVVMIMMMIMIMMRWW